MQLDRDINPDGKGKYALIKLRDLPTDDTSIESIIQALLEKPIHVDEAIDLGLKGSDSEFFVIRLKDKFAPAALRAYANEALSHGHVEYSEEILRMAERAENHPNRKEPD